MNTREQAQFRSMLEASKDPGSKIVYYSSSIKNSRAAFGRWGTYLIRHDVESSHGFRLTVFPHGSTVTFKSITETTDRYANDPSIKAVYDELPVPVRS